MDWKDHNLASLASSSKVRFDQKPVLDRDGAEVDGLHSLWITLDNPDQLNSYTTEMVKDLILAFRSASNDRAAVAVVFTGSGSRAFCTGGNTKEYAEYYAGKPGEYQQYMRLFNDMVTAILHCDLPVICRVNGLRVAGGQEIGMACDISVASDLALFGQAGPKHGSAPDGGSTDFLPLFVGIEAATISCTLCQMWSAHKAHRLGLIHQIVPVLEVGDQRVPNPMVQTQAVLDDMGRWQHGELLQGPAREAGKKVLREGNINLEHLDKAVHRVITDLLYTMPGCTSKTLQSLRKHKLEHWDRNRETNRAWLGLNMMTEANAGFRSFNVGQGKNREVDFIALRRALAAGQDWGEELIESVMPKVTV